MQYKIIPLARLISERESAILKTITMENANHARGNLLLTLPGMWMSRSSSLAETYTI